jgi:hypothetical protein
LGFIATADSRCVAVLLVAVLQCLTYIDEAELDFSHPVWQAVSPEARVLVAAMLTKDPASRPSAQKLLDKYSAWLSRGDQLDMQ